MRNGIGENERSRKVLATSKMGERGGETNWLVERTIKSKVSNRWRKIRYEFGLGIVKEEVGERGRKKTEGKRTVKF